MNRAPDSLSSRDLNRLCTLVYDQAGIKLGPEKQVMLEGRLRRRMNKLNLHSYRDYCEYLFDGRGIEVSELPHLIDAVTTNKTEFFRERVHFDLLTKEVIPEICARAGNNREVTIWSAGCSTGEEPYTLAMVLSEYARQNNGLRFRILATDISTVVLERAMRGVYSAEAARDVAPELLRRYFMRSRDRESRLVRVIPEIRKAVEFRRLNLMEDFAIPEPMDAIFCRNVVIYFDQPTQEQLFLRFSRQLVDGGYIFLGHSESLHCMNLPFEPVAPALYRKEMRRHEH